MTTTKGFTLVEVLIVVVILATLAAVVIPSFSVIDTKKFEQSISEVRYAIEYSQNLAKTTNTAHGVHFRSVEQDVRVYRVDTSGASPTRIYDVRHPISKKLFKIQLNTSDNSTTIDDIHIKYQNINFSEYLEFSASSATPMFNESGNLREIKKADITLVSGSSTVIIRVGFNSGKVTEI